MPEPFAPRRAAGALCAALLAAAPLAAQTNPALPPPPPPLSARPVAAAAAPSGTRPLSLDEALTLAEENSDQVVVAQAGVMRARGQRLQAASQRYPQLGATASYSRALASQFSSLSGGSDTTTATPGPTNCGKFTPNPALPVQQRLDSLEHAVDCAANSNPFSSLGSLPFGNKNTWSLGLNLSQNLFAGGRIAAQVDASTAARRRADIQLASTRAQLVLDVAQAYYNAALADRLVSISEATFAQAEETLRQVTLAKQVGNQPEFELLRAQVTRDNQRPVLIQRRADRELAYTRLRLLLNLSADAPLALTTPLNDAAPVPVARFASNPNLLGDTVTMNRAPVRQAAQTIAAQEAQLKVARAGSLATVSLVSNYGRVAYPGGALPALGDFATNWTVGAQLSVPVFTGGRLRGDRMVAEAAVLEARAQFEGTKQLAVLDTRNALLQLASARAQWQASAGTVEQATRAYQIAEIRYREGLSTQTELTDSRILLQQSQANRAQAARDLQIAQVHVALLADLPISIGQASGAAAQQQAAPQQTTPQQQQPAQPQAAQSTAAFSGAGIVP
ncbi:MAG TPA: TolC family protein [Longimicrobium sp.]|jgi:outer membrane protein TolC|nr:TolC family protein [Longimicrobium sp.]